MIKVIIADDQELIRQSLQIVLELEENIEVLDAVANGNEVLESIEREVPDVILMDIRMPEMDGVVCTRLIKERHPEIKIIDRSGFNVANLFRGGVFGVGRHYLVSIPKNSSNLRITTLALSSLKP